MKLSGGKPRKHGGSAHKKVGKVGSKRNPFSSKAKASRSTRKGVKYYKKAGRTLKFKKSKANKKH